MSYNKLLFNSISFNYAMEGVNPHFICPVCGFKWEPKYKPVPSLPEVYDLNRKVSFTIFPHKDKEDKQCSANNKTITLYVAIHKDSKIAELCLQKSDDEGVGGIPTDWWKQYV